MSLLCSLMLLAASDTTTVRRFALLIGANDGGAGRVRLRYAVSDAESVSRVLEELGGVKDEDRVLLKEPNADGIRRAIDELGAKVAKLPVDHQRRELVLYYSGHSDGEALLLGKTRLSYRELRQAIGTLPLDVRIAVLDSCASGAFVRMKGGNFRSPFLIDESTRASGYAYISSSAANEGAQEADGIGASLFTHYLVSGLRGAADVTHDGLVTLNEAYQFAFSETLQRSERTQGGAQHAAYDIGLAGSGDLVLTDLRKTSARLALDQALEGRVFIRDAAEHLVAELGKPAQKVVELGLPPGNYRVLLDVGEQRYAAPVQLADGRQTRLAMGAFSPAPVEEATSRGDLQLDFLHRPPPPDLPLRVQAFSTDVNLVNAAVRYGGHFVYGLVTAGIAGARAPFHGSVGIGFGGHIPAGPFFVDVDTVANTVFYAGAQTKNVWLQQRAMLSWPILRHFAFFAGPTLNASVVGRPVGIGLDGHTLTPIGQRYFDNHQVIVCVWPGLVIGISI